MPRHGGSDGFLAMRRSFEEAASSYPAGAAARSGMIAGRDFSLTLVGTDLIDALVPSFAHLTGSAVRSGRSGTASVALWDSESAATAPPAVPNAADWVASGEGWRVTSHNDGRYLCEERPASLLWLDRLEAQLVGCFAGGRRLGCADRARPLQRVMSEFCRSLGIQEIHAGLVAEEGRGVLIVGGGGRGKTTASLDGLHGGLQFLGDDSVAIGDDGTGGIIGHCLYASARVRAHQLARWPQFEGHWRLPEPPEEKALLLPSTFLAHRVGRSVRIVAIAIPAVTGRGLHIEPTSGVDAFHALVHESRDNRRFGLTAEEFTRLVRMTQRVPCYRLEVDDDPDSVAGAIRTLMDRAVP